MNKLSLLCLALPILTAFPDSYADDLYSRSSWAHLAGDQKASQIGDSLIVIVYQAAEARNTSENSAERRTDLNVNFGKPQVEDYDRVGAGSRFTGQGEFRRTESFTTQISVDIIAILPTGAYIIEGRQVMKVNGESSEIAIRGKIRPEDISPENTIISTRISDAEINYQGQGFVSRAAKPGIVQSLLNRLGLL
ncbi:flagellar basal body L-ring protein FlgH [Woodsholea maritima]|uniref:flagellar basal body L-ring protein FlgH n=1 Tax=Woodsholea maritima TaxID=240237 RepID=UPI000381A0C2|nr:flagellar basal body L-ring protein FlgH [Woodsholea maritima]